MFINQWHRFIDLKDAMRSQEAQSKNVESSAYAFDSARIQIPLGLEDFPTVCTDPPCATETRSDHH
jgi:hypothetical protein